MITWVPNKLIQATIINDISALRASVHCMRPRRKQGTVYSLFALETRCAFDTNLLRVSQSKLIFLFYYAWTVHRACVTGTNLIQRKDNDFIAFVLRVPNVRLALV